MGEPSDWFAEYDGDYLNIQNFISPQYGSGQWTPGNLRLTVSQWRPDENIRSLSQLQALLDKDNQKENYYIGGPVGKVISQDEQIKETNGFQTFYREISYTESLNLNLLQVYLLDGKGGVIIVSFVPEDQYLDIFDQILSTFKFLDTN